MSTSPGSCGSLFQPLRLNGLQLPNRLVVAPMTRISATAAGAPTEMMGRYYARFVRGGFGLIISEGIYTDQAYSQGYASQPGLSDVSQANDWRPIVDIVHRAGGHMFAQLMHAGALSQANRFRVETVGPSAIRPRGIQMRLYGGDGQFAMPRAMTSADIDEVIRGFIQAARLAIDVAGFDGVEIHGANGYLLDQFLTDYTNHRTDQWGGGVENRIRLSVQIARAVRDALGSAVPVGLRISQAKVNDLEHQWQGGESAALVLFEHLSHAGLDYLHLTEFQAWQPAFKGADTSLVGYARRAAPGLTIMANGSLHEAARAAQVMTEGADLVALGRGALANPDWPARVAAHRPVRPFQAQLLAPLGDIKPSELGVGTIHCQDDSAADHHAA